MERIKGIRRSFWFVLAAGVIVWIVLGFTLPRENFPLNDLFDIFSVGVFFMCLVFVATYTLAGIIGPKPRHKWWMNEVGTYFVLSFTSIMFIVGPVALAVLFNDGQIDTWWWAWIWLGGHVLAAVMIGLLAFIWVRNFRSERRAQRAS